MTERAPTPAPGPAAAAPVSEDTSSLTWLLVVVGLANVIGISHSVMSREEILALRPEFSPRLLDVAMSAAVINVVSVGALLRWKRWGAIGLGAGLLTLLVTNALGDAPLALTLLAPIALLLVGMYLWPWRTRLT